jgi:hypothetical protein
MAMDNVENCDSYTDLVFRFPCIQFFIALDALIAKQLVVTDNFI